MTDEPSPTSETASLGPVDDDSVTSVRQFADDDRPRGVTDVEVAVFEGEAVLFHESASMVHHLGAIAGAVWWCLDGETTVNDMVDELADAFGIDAGGRDQLAANVRSALAQFDAKGLLDDAGPPPATIALEPERTTAADGTEILAADDP